MKPTVIDPKTTTRAEASDLWMSTPNPHGDILQNTGCNAALPAQPQAWAEIQHAALLVHRKGCR